MSNYPPGVTGREYAIAGPDIERDESRTCDEQDVTILTISETQRLLLKQVINQGYAAMREDDQVRQLPVMIGRLQSVLSGIEEVVGMDCPFDGDVTVQGYHGVLTWECPVCHTEHEEEVGGDE